MYKRQLPEGETSAERFCDNILYNNRVFITPGFIFGSNGEGYVRISLCAPVPTLRAALARL